MTLNEKTRIWADSVDGKEYQCMIFQTMFDYRVSQFRYGDGKYDWMGRGFIETKAKKENTNLEHGKFIDAIQRLEEHGFVKSEYHRTGEDYRIMKKGWERWERISKGKSI